MKPQPLLIALGLLFAWTGHAADKPNILFLFTDDQPQSCMGIMGNAHNQDTPS